MAPFLNLTLPEISAIEEDGQTAEQRRKMVLDKWIKKNGMEAKYICLLEVCLEAKDRELADRICEEVKKKVTFIGI